MLARASVSGAGCVWHCREHLTEKNIVAEVGTI